MELDRITQLQNRARRGLPLFNGDTTESVVEVVYWRARNGFDHIIAVIRQIRGQVVKESRQAPWLNPERLKYCEKKRADRAAHLEQIREADRKRKAIYRQRRKQEKALRRACHRTYRSL